MELAHKFHDFDWWRRAQWSDLRGHLLLMWAEKREADQRAATAQRPGGAHNFGRPPDLRLVPREGEGPRS